MTSLFGDTNIRPFECIHSNKQHPTDIRCMNKWVIQSGLPTNLSASSSEKSIRKYFGKGVKTLTYFNKAPSFNASYRCKFVKTAKIYSLTPIKYPLRSIENLHVFDTSALIIFNSQNKQQEKQLLGNVSSYKRLKYIEAETYRHNSSIKPLKFLANLQMLSLTMKEEQFAQNYQIMLSLKSLKRLNLSLLSLGTEDTLISQHERPAISDFLIEATKQRKLDFLGIKLTHVFDIMGPKSRSRFLECLSTTGIPEFNIELVDTNISHIDPERLRSCIQNIDLLELDVDKNASVSILCGTERLTEKPRKKLKIIFKLAGPNATQVETEADSLSPMDGLHLEGLRDLDLASKLEKLFRDCFAIPFTLSGTSSIKHLKSFSVNFARMIEKMSETIDPIFFATLQNESQLEHLQLQRYTGHHYFSILSQAPAMQNLTSLHFTDFPIQENFFTLLSEILGSLKNVKTLRLDLQIAESIDDKVKSKPALIAPEKSKLSEVSIKLPVLNKNMISDFIKLILSLNELEVLTLHSGNQLIETEKNRLSLLDGFKRLKKLREVSIFRTIQKTLFMSGVRNDHKHPVVAKVQNELKELFDMNCSVWKLCIESNNPAYQIRYKRY